MVKAASDVLAQVSEEILGQPVFEPLTAETEFRIAMADVAEIVYLPGLLRHFAEHAPCARVTTVSVAPDALQGSMAKGEVDLAIGYFPDLGSQNFFKQKLYMHSYACLLRKDHPLRDGLSLADYQTWGHAVAASPARSSSLLEQHLRRHGIRRRVVLQTPHHLSLPAIVGGTDLIATVPLAVGTRFAAHGELQLMPMPLRPPRFSVQQHWHRLVHKDSRNVWLRHQVAKLFVQASSEWSEVDATLYPGAGNRADS